MTEKNTHVSWKNPPVSTMQRCGLAPLPEDFDPTPQERVLLDMYESVRKYEKQAKRIREESARKKLEASRMAFEQRRSPNDKRIRRVKVNTEAEDSGSDAETSVEESETDKVNEEEKAMDKYRRRQEKLDALRQEVDQKRHTQEQLEEERRAKHLEKEEDDVLAALSVHKKVKTTPAASSSLIANLKAAATPPHEFSSSYELQRGEILFPSTQLDMEQVISGWSPPQVSLLCSVENEFEEAYSPAITVTFQLYRKADSVVLLKAHSNLC